MKRLQRRFATLLNAQTKPQNAMSANSPLTSTKSAAMPAAADLSSSSPISSKPASPKPPNISTALPPRDALSVLPPNATISEPQHIFITVHDEQGGTTQSFLHLPSTTLTAVPPRTAVILVSGVYGGVVGPSGIYLSLATKLATLPTSPVPSLRLDYRHPGRTNFCIADTEAAMKYLEEHHSISHFILVGWSFGGAPVFTIAGRDERVIGAATVASQPAGALRGAYEAGKKNLPVLLLHGTSDQILNHHCSRELHGAYKAGIKESWRQSNERDSRSEDEGRIELVLFDGDDHGLTRDAIQAERLLADFIVQCVSGAIVGEESKEIVESDLMGSREERIEIMHKGGDLKDEKY